ncbi:MAG: AAA family ATPase, partial [Deltaproteobacteria bacterium]|nr:AAA family ATPase [Deltaproteobacteria bacterium]
MKVIGAIGQNGSGKDEILKYLKAACGVPFFSTGDMVREIAAEEGIEATRDNLRVISERWFSERGEGCFVRLLAERIKKEEDQTVGISGIRSLADVTILKGFFGDDFILINVTMADPRQRYERMVSRGEERDPHSYEQFLALDRAEEDLFHVEEAGRQAQCTIGNDGKFLKERIRLIEQSVLSRVKLREGFAPLLTLPGVGKILG